MADETRTLLVKFEGDSRGLNRAARRAADDVEDASRRISRTAPLIEAGLSPFVDNDIAGLIANNLAKIPPPALAAAGAVAAVGVAMAGTAALGGAAGIALAGVASWLYGRDPTSPLGVAITDINAEFDQLANTVDLIVRPVFDDLAQAWGPIVIDLLQRLGDWLINNREQVENWILAFADAFIHGVIVATYLGQAFTILSSGGAAVLITALGLVTKGIGNVMYAIGWLTGSEGLMRAGQDFRDAGDSAFKMRDQLIDMAEEGYGALGEIREGAQEADDALDDLEGDRKVNVIYSSVGFETIRRQGQELAGAIRPHSASAYTAPSTRAAPVVNVTVNSLLADTAMVRQLEPTFRQVLAEIDRRNGVR